MYIVKCDGQLLYDPRIEELEIFSPKLAFEDNKKAGFDFTIYPTHPLYNSIRKLKSTIEVYRDGVRLFRGRWVDDERDWNNQRKIECDDDLSFLDDSIVRPYEYQGDVEPYLKQLIDSHNDQVEAEKRFVLRDVTVTDPNGYITRANINYPNTWSEIEDKLIKLLGGHIMLEYADGVNYLDYLADSPYRSNQKIELGQNLLDLKETDLGADVATAIIPLGAKLKDESGNDTDERLTIAGVNGGKDYVYSEEAVNAYGWIHKTVSFDDVTQATNLLRKANEELATAVNQEITLELTALDLSHMDKAISDFRFMDYVEAYSKPHNLDELFLISKLNLDMTNPANDKLTLGMTYKSFTGTQVDTRKRIETINADYVKNEQVNAVKNEIVNVYSTIDQTASQIITVGEGFVSQSEHETFKQETSTQFKQTTDTFSFQFSSLVSQVNEMDEGTRAQFEELVKYIRFENGNILLGQVGNELTLKISHDRIGFSQSGVEVAYFSNNKLYIEDAEVLTSIKIGKFRFSPRENGNLSFALGG